MMQVAPVIHYGGLTNISQGLKGGDIGEASMHYALGSCQRLFVDAVLMQQHKPKDFGAAIGHQFAVYQFNEWSSVELGMIMPWEGLEFDEVCYCDERAIVRGYPCCC